MTVSCNRTQKTWSKVKHAMPKQCPASQVVSRVSRRCIKKCKPSQRRNTNNRCVSRRRGVGSASRRARSRTATKRARSRTAPKRARSRTAPKRVRGSSKRRKFSKYPARINHLFFLNEASRGRRVTSGIVKKYPHLFAPRERRRYG